MRHRLGPFRRAHGRFTAKAQRLDKFLRDTIVDLERKPPMSRLQEKLQQAAGVAGRTTARIEARADALIARESALAAREEEVFAPHESVLAQASRGLDEAEAALRLLSNDPLGG